MLLQRVLTAIVLIPLTLAGIYLLPDTGFRLFVGVITVLAAWEWANLSGYKNQFSRVAIAAVVAAVLVLVHTFIDVNSIVWPILSLITLPWWLYAASAVVRYPDSARWLCNRALTLLMLVPVLIGCWVGLVWLKNQPQSALLLTWLMLLVWGADIGAYFAGRAFGKKKLAPQVSPGKTWAGVYGGVVTSMVISIVIALVFLTGHSLKGWLWLLLISSALIGFSVMGDLFESLLKRHRGIKDSSALLPGHGGVLDRTDSLCAATPVFVLLWFVLSVI
ncbi:phosphatidate cytidylyltransferase [Reinekea thalattae]|uniref:Phosphatidate cytidylyltransferase n=1 Tax=Reinekea thalattae TaxID=2593301 RepID=A0A5C8Z9X6_9GAMM|nr:phosphatidate cytidylyltransferase [Reinekea thalattae]TXR54079.1 phosphatidate cytidylyltransferase [Reinekea thalattae]